MAKLKLLTSPAKGETTRKQWSAAFSSINKKNLARAAKAAYERFVRESGYEHDSRIREWKKLKEVHRIRWTAIAGAVITAFGGEDRGSNSSSVRGADERPRRLPKGNTKAAA